MNFASVRGLYIFEQATKLLKENKVTIKELISTGDKTIVWFKVQGKSDTYDVRFLITEIEDKRYMKEWSCSCQHSSWPKGTECSHRIASLVRLVQMIGWGK